MRFRVPRKQKPALARQTALTKDLPAPIGGVNTRDSLSAMSPVDAIELINWIPQQNGLVSRQGFEEATDGYASSIETQIPYIQGLTQVLVTASSDVLYTDDGNGTLTSLGTGFSNARWDGVKLGANMVLVNGVDAPRNFDGTVLTTPSFSGDLSTYGPENINGIHKFRNRVYMWDTRNPDFFYGGTNSVSGAFTKFQLSRVSDTSGNIIEIKTITHNTGQGLDDYIAFILHTGEVLLYQGSDPGDAANFSLVGKFKAPPIIGKRCAVEFAGDILLLTKQDLIKLSDVINYTSESGGFNLQPSKLSGGIANDYKAYSSNYGFSITTYPRGGWIIINIPEVPNSIYHQWILNTVTGAATKFTGWNGASFGVLGDNLYFGGSEILYQADSGLDDNGADIVLFARTAFSNLDSGNKKKVSNVRLYMASDGALNIALSIGYDFAFANPQGVQASATSGAEWDVATWDVDEWASTQARLINFVTAGIGVHVSIQISLQVNGQQINWYAATYNYDRAKAY